MHAEQKPSRLQSFWRRRVIGLIVAQLTQGVSPEKIALTIALGSTIAIFPIMGSTTVLCLIVGVWCKLNQPIIQFVNWLVWPLQIVFIPIFVRMGEWIVRAKPVPFSVPELLEKFRASPGKFMQEFGMTGVHGIIAWSVTAVILIPLLYFILLPPLRKLASLIKLSPRHAD